MLSYIVCFSINNEQLKNDEKRTYKKLEKKTATVRSYNSGYAVLLRYTQIAMRYASGCTSSSRGLHSTGNFRQTLTHSNVRNNKSNGNPSHKKLIGETTYFDFRTF